MSDGSSYVYVGVASDDRHTPVVAGSLEDACGKAVEAFDLRHAANDPSNWDKQYDALQSELKNKQAWRIRVRAQWWDYATIHRIDAEEVDIIEVTA